MKRPLNRSHHLEEFINSYYPSLTKAEQKVADYVLNNMEKVIYVSVTDLAEEAEVGETTVLRFCRKIGLKGYQEFKLTIAQGLSNSSDQSVTEEVDEASSSWLSMSISDNMIQTIQSTATFIDDEELSKVVDLIDQARSVHFFGVGTSGLTCLDAKNRFIRIGKHVDASVDSHVQAMTASTLSEGDLVIGFSVSGSTVDTINSMQIARDNGATVVAITYYLRSPITKVADIVLRGGGKESPLEGGSLAAKISQLYILDLLCTGLTLKNKEFSLKMKEKTARSVVNKIY